MSAYANATIRFALSGARFMSMIARKHGASPASMDFSRGLYIGTIHTARGIEGADRLAAMAAENEAKFLLGDYLRNRGRA